MVVPGSFFSSHPLGFSNLTLPNLHSTTRRRHSRPSHTTALQPSSYSPHRSLDNSGLNPRIPHTHHPSKRHSPRPTVQTTSTSSLIYLTTISTRGSSPRYIATEPTAPADKQPQKPRSQAWSIITPPLPSHSTASHHDGPLHFLLRRRRQPPPVIPTGCPESIKKSRFCPAREQCVWVAEQQARFAEAARGRS